MCELRALIIDEISIVSNLQLLYIHLRLVEIFGCSENVSFAGITVIAVGDFYQLPPVQQRTVYAEYRQNLVHLWNLFKLAELCEVMRQRGASNLTDLLNKVRTASLEENDENILKSRFLSQNDDSYPTDVLYIFVENKPCQEHNRTMLNSNGNFLCTIPAIDQGRRQGFEGGWAPTFEEEINA